MLLIGNSQLHNLITFKLCCKYCYYSIIIPDVFIVIIVIITINNLYTAAGSPGSPGLECDDGERIVHQENKDKMVNKDHPGDPIFIKCPTQGEQGEPGPQKEKGD